MSFGSSHFQAAFEQQFGGERNDDSSIRPVTEQVDETTVEIDPEALVDALIDQGEYEIALRVRRNSTPPPSAS